jgi:hypothetical protein
MGGSEGALGEEVRGELHSGLHVSLDLHLALHEGSLGVELSREEVNGIAIDQREGGIGLALLGVLDRSIAVLEINSPEDGILTLGRRNLEVVDEPDLLDRLSAISQQYIFMRSYLKLSCHNTIGLEYAVPISGIYHDGALYSGRE